ncbi:hypothetical protein MKX03_015431 [Papaver bracteatum]|nr:hypothetical protein MKX03_015431 [Papaver bracteatum]
MVGFSHAIKHLKPYKNIIQEEELLPDLDFPQYSIPLVNSSIPDFDFIDEWLKETDSMDTEVSLNSKEIANSWKQIEVKSEQTEILGSLEIPLVQEACKGSIGVDSSIEIALDKVNLVATSESSDVVDMNSEAVVTSGSGNCLLEKNLMVSGGGGGNDVSLGDDDLTKSHNNDGDGEGDKESNEMVKGTCKGGVDSSIEIALDKVNLVATSESSDVVDMNSEAVVTSGSGNCLLEKSLMVRGGGGGNDVSLGDDLTKSHNNDGEGDKESNEMVKETCKGGVDSSIEIALDKVNLVATSESSDVVDMNSEAVVTSGSGNCLLEKNLMVSGGGGNDVSLGDDLTKPHNNDGEGDKESNEIVKDCKDGDNSSESENDDDDEDDESEDESSTSSESSDEEEMCDVEEGEFKDLEELIGESDGDEEGFSVKGPIKSKNEVQDLPPVPKVDITLEPHHQTLPVGAVLTIMDAKVIVHGVEKHNPLNEGSILWITENRSVLGLVDEIFGPVKNPYYVVRYNSKEEVPAGISEGTLVSFVVEFADHVLNDKNIYKKGYDASGENDEELTDEAEFSDDEKEAEYKRMQRMAKRGPSDDKKHGKLDSVDKKKFQQKPRNVNNNQISFPPSSVPPHQIHGGSGSYSSPFGTGMANNFRPPFGPSTSQVPQAYSGPAPQQHPRPSNMGPAPQQHPWPSNMGPAPQQHPWPSNMGPAPQQHPLPSNMGVTQQQHPWPSNMGPAPQQHPLPSNMGPAPQQHPLPSNMGVTQQQHPLPSNMVWPNGPPYQQNAAFPMNAMPFVPYQQSQPFYHPQMFTGFSSGPPIPQHFNPSQPLILSPMPYGPSNILPGMPPAMPVFVGQPGFNQGAIQMGFQGFPPRPHMNPGEQGVSSQGSLNQTHINVGEQGVQSQGSGPLNEQNNGVRSSSTQGNYSAQNRVNNWGAARGRRPYLRGGGRGRH